MGFFRSEPKIGNSNLTQSDIDRLLDLDDDYRTDYTYVTSKSYRPDGTDEYENPRMSRLSLSHYRRKWAFEKARKAGYLYYTYFCLRDYLSHFLSNPVKMLFTLIIGFLQFIIRVLWFALEIVFPNPEVTHVEEVRRMPLRPINAHKKTAQTFEAHYDDVDSMDRDEDYDEPASSHSQSHVWRPYEEPQVSLGSFAGIIGRFIVNVLTFGAYPQSGNEQTLRGSVNTRWPNNYEDESRVWHGRSSKSRTDPSRNVRRRVKTSTYEYMEDREPEFDARSVPTKKSQGFVESLISKIFYLIFIGLLSPFKTVEYACEKASSLLGLSHPVYDLRSRMIYANQPLETDLPYTDRLASFLSDLSTSCLMSIASTAFKLLFAPINVFSCIVGKAVGQTSQRPLYRATAETARRDYLPWRIFLFVIDVITGLAASFISAFSVLQSIPFYIAEHVRERIAGMLAKMFGASAAGLVGYEEVRPIVERTIQHEMRGVIAKQKIPTAFVKKSELMPTDRSLKYCSLFWKWIFPLIILLLLTRGSLPRYGDGGQSAVNIVKLPCKVLRSIFSGAETLIKVIRDGIHSILRAALSSFALPFRLLNGILNQFVRMLRSVFSYPAKGIEEIVELPRYIYNIGGYGVTSSKRMFNIPAELYHLLSGIFVNTKSMFVSHVYHNFLNVLSSAWEFVYDMGKLFYALPSLVFSRTAGVLPFFKNSAIKEHLNNVDFTRKMSDKSGVLSSERDWSLKKLKHEKDLLDEKMTQLRREREIEEDRYKDLQEAIRLVGEVSVTSPAENDRALKAMMVNEELLQHKIEKNFHDYVAKLRATEDAEISKRLLSIENRLSSKLNDLSKLMENELSDKITQTTQQSGKGHVTLAEELVNLSAAITSLQSEFDKLRREKEAKIAEFAQAIVVRDTKQGDDLNILKHELDNKIKADLEKSLSTTLNQYEQSSQAEREAFRSEIMKMVENRVIAMFARHLVDRGAAESTMESKAKSVPGLSETDFKIIGRMITEALDKYDADKTGKVDYALESSGGSVLSTRCTEEYKENSRLESLFGIPLWYSSYSPRAVIQYRSLAAGECWAFRGEGYLTIKLSRPIHITEVSYEHIHSTLHPEGVLRSAPQRFKIYSYKTVSDLNSKFLLGEYEYDINGRALQVFPVQNKPRYPVNIIELFVESNWGEKYTCLYRLRVHGERP